MENKPNNRINMEASIADIEFNDDKTIITVDQIKEFHVLNDALSDSIMGGPCFSSNIHIHCEDEQYLFVLLTDMKKWKSLYVALISRMDEFTSPDCKWRTEDASQFINTTKKHESIFSGPILYLPTDIYNLSMEDIKHRCDEIELE